MKHLGDITKVNGAQIEPVDVVVGGSPCQDLSIAGNRAGLGGGRSGLFMEQLRIIKEMRDATNNRAARYMVWENVPGAFSSNKAEDFRIVLEETARVADSDAVIPRPPKNKWATAGCVMGDGWSIAWRVQDAQFWGVPQRRRRIALVADFGGQSAPEILFERQGVSGDIAESGTAREGTAGDAEGGFGETGGVKCLNPDHPQSAQIYSADGVWHSLNANENGGQIEPKSAFKENWAESTVNNALRAEASRPSNVICLQGNGIDRADTAGCNGKGWREDVRYTLNTIDRPAIVAPFDTTQITSPQNKNRFEYGAPYHTLNSRAHVPAVVARMTAFGQYETDGTFSAKKQRDYKDATDLVVASVDCRNMNESDVHGTLQSKPNGGQSLNYSGAVRTGYAVRRLTTLECERLQGYPDGWTDIPNTAVNDRLVKASDSVQYKALGNSIALPPWRFVLYRIYSCGARTLGSLFDGIGGFPLIWSELPNTDTPWASEIEPFPIAVTMRRFIGKEESI